MEKNPNGKKPPQNASLILLMKRIHSMFMCTNTKEAPTPWSSSTDWKGVPTHNFLAPSCRPDMFSGTNLKETMIPYSTSPNCPEYKDGSELRPLLETASNHWLNHSAKSLSEPRLISTLCQTLLYPYSTISQSSSIYIWSYPTKPLLGFSQKLLGFLPVHHKVSS